MILPWWACSILANVCLVGMEYQFRTVGGGFLQLVREAWWIMIPGQYFLYYAYNGAPHWMVAWLVFVTGSAACRVFYVNLFAGHEVMHWSYVAVGMALVLLGGGIVKRGLV